MRNNPFEGMTDRELYDAFRCGRFGFTWPAEREQASYGGCTGGALVRRSKSFVDMLARDGAFVTEWRGLDYGCGWGRFASVLLAKGDARQLDLCDAWPRPLRLVRELGYGNRLFRVPELLTPDEIEGAAYDFVLSFSVFTHLSPRAIENNIPVLLRALRPGGTLYITVRHEEFIDHKYPERSGELHETLRRDGILFVETGGDQTGGKLFGDTVIGAGYLPRFGDARYLGAPHSLQHVYAISRSSA